MLLLCQFLQKGNLELSSGLKPSPATYWLNDLGTIISSLSLSFYICNLENKIPTEFLAWYQNYTKSRAGGREAKMAE